MEKVLIYPFNYNFFTILNHCNKISDIEINSLVSPSGWGYAIRSIMLIILLLKLQMIFKVNLKRILWYGLLIQKKI